MCIYIYMYMYNTHTYANAEHYTRRRIIDTDEVFAKKFLFATLSRLFWKFVKDFKSYHPSIIILLNLIILLLLSY